MPRRSATREAAVALEQRQEQRRHRVERQVARAGQQAQGARVVVAHDQQRTAVGAARPRASGGLARELELPGLALRAARRARADRQLLRTAGGDSASSARSDRQLEIGQERGVRFAQLEHARVRAS